MISKQSQTISYNFISRKHFQTIQKMSFQYNPCKNTKFTALWMYFYAHLSSFVVTIQSAFYLLIIEKFLEHKCKCTHCIALLCCLYYSIT